MLPELPTKLFHAIRTFIRAQDTPNDTLAQRMRRREESSSCMHSNGPFDSAPREIDPAEYQLQRIRIAHFRLNALEMPSLTSVNATTQIARLRETLSQLEEETKATADYVQQIEEKESHKLDLIKHVECPICCDPLLDPYTVSPCGHVVCFMCLRRWFNAFLIDVPAAHRAEPHHYIDISEVRLNTCPVCRVIINKPTPLYIIRDLVEALGLGRLSFSELQIAHNNPYSSQHEMDISIDGSVDEDFNSNWEDVDDEEDANEDIEKLCKIKMMDENGKLHWGGFFLEDMAKCDQCGGPALEGHCLGYQLPPP